MTVPIYSLIASGHIFFSWASRRVTHIDLENTLIAQYQLPPVKNQMIGHKVVKIRNIRSHNHLMGYFLETKEKAYKNEVGIQIKNRLQQSKRASRRVRKEK